MRSLSLELLAASQRLAWAMAAGLLDLPVPSSVPVPPSALRRRPVLSVDLVWCVADAVEDASTDPVLDRFLRQSGRAR
eukprot:SAG25_NODE_205_length_11932_cov_40.485760_13_plen_78_part_00